MDQFKACLIDSFPIPKMLNIRGSFLDFTHQWQKPRMLSTLHAIQFNIMCFHKKFCYQTCSGRSDWNRPQTDCPLTLLPLVSLGSPALHRETMVSPSLFLPTQPWTSPLPRSTLAQTSCLEIEVTQFWNLEYSEKSTFIMA